MPSHISKNLVLRLTRKCFTHMVTITDEGLQTYNQHSELLGSEGSLTCQTYCDTCHPFIGFMSEGPWHFNKLLSVWQWCYPTCFYDLCLSQLGIEPNFLHAKQTLYRLDTVVSLTIWFEICATVKWNAAHIAHICLRLWLSFMRNRNTHTGRAFVNVVITTCFYE